MLRIAESIRQSLTQDGAILLDVHRGQILSVNVTGARILELVQRGRDESEIVDEISRAYKADENVVRRDVVEFLRALGNHHILQSTAETRGLDQPGGIG